MSWVGGSRGLTVRLWRLRSLVMDVVLWETLAVGLSEPITHFLGGLVSCLDPSLRLSALVSVRYLFGYSEPRNVCEMRCSKNLEHFCLRPISLIL